MSRVKNSASVIGTPSNTFFRELTEGLTRFCSMSEIRPLVTPARRASARCERPKVMRTLRRRAPTSMLMAVQYPQRNGRGPAPDSGLCRIYLSFWRFFHKTETPSLLGDSRHVTPGCPVPRRSRSLLDAVHCQPAVQRRTAPARQGLRYALLDAGWPANPGCGRRTLVRERGPRAPRDYRSGVSPARDDGLRAAVPD